MFGSAQVVFNNNKPISSTVCPRRLAVAVEKNSSALEWRAGTANGLARAEPGARAAAGAGPKPVTETTQHVVLWR